MALTLKEKLIDKFKQECKQQTWFVNGVFKFEPANQRKVRYIQYASRIQMGIIDALMITDANINVLELDDELTKIVTEIGEQEIK